jgi:hypothetical protein
MAGLSAIDSICVVKLTCNSRCRSVAPTSQRDLVANHRLSSVNKTECPISGQSTEILVKKRLSAVVFCDTGPAETPAKALTRIR